MTRRRCILLAVVSMILVSVALLLAEYGLAKTEQPNESAREVQAAEEFGRKADALREQEFAAVQELHDTLEKMFLANEKGAGPSELALAKLHLISAAARPKRHPTMGGGMGIVISLPSKKFFDEQSAKLAKVERIAADRFAASKSNYDKAQLQSFKVVRWEIDGYLLDHSMKLRK